MTFKNSRNKITREKALKIANDDASLIYSDLTPYEIESRLENGNWVIDYEIKDPNVVGGGPHYIISGITGKILLFRYDQ